MSKFPCVCGATLSNHQFPNDIEIIFYSNREWEKVICCDSIDDIPDPEWNVWKCDRCERLHFFKDNKLIKTYVIEKEYKKEE